MMMHIRVPSDFDFWRTVYSHGWSSLPPFFVDKERGRLQRILELSNRKPLMLSVFPRSKNTVSVRAEAGFTVTAPLRKEIISSVKSCLRLEENYSEFYCEAKRHPRFRWVPKTGAGRLLRAPTVFEDVVKMICTTNCSWALTEIMTENLCKKLGSKFQVPRSGMAPEALNSGFTFPSPHAIADCSEKFLRKEIRVGYRAPYLLELSRRIVKKEIDIEQWRSSTIPTEELFDEVRSVKGIGPYAAGNILKLLGRYDYLAIDSWCRKQFFDIHKNSRKTSDKVIEKHYASFGTWRGLFFWMDVTKHWYDKKHPF